MDCPKVSVVVLNDNGVHLNSQGYGFRLGTRYKLTEIVDLNLLVKLEQKEFKSAHSSSLSFEEKWAYKPGPRTILSITYSDERNATYLKIPQ